MTQAFLFFSFQLALPKTSVLLLCQHNSRFLTFFILFFAPLPLSFAFGTFRPLPFGSLLVFLFYVVSFAVFLGQYSLFFNICLFQQSFSYLFYIVFCPLPFAVCYLGILLFALWKFTRLLILCCIIRCLFGAGFALLQCLCVSTAIFLPFLYCFCPFALFSFAFETFCSLPFPLLLKHFALCPLEVCPLFSYSRLFHSLSFGGSTRSFSMSVCFNSRFLTFLCIVFCPLPLSFAFGTFRALPFSILQTAFCPLLPPFVVFFLFCVWNSPFALLLTAICCKNLLLDKKFSKNKKSLEIVIKTFDNT